MVCGNDIAIFALKTVAKAPFDHGTLTAKFWSLIRDDTLKRVKTIKSKL